MFAKLMFGIMSSNKSNDFRLRLNHKLQEVIRARLETSKVLETDKATERVFDDIDKVLAWTELISFRVPDEYDIGTKLYEEQVKTNKPSRTFDFDAAKLLKSESKKT
jgi:hypothetical protein